MVMETSPEADVDACLPNKPSGKKVSLPTGRKALPVRLNSMTLLPIGRRVNPCLIQSKFLFSKSIIDIYCVTLIPLIPIENRVVALFTNLYKSALKLNAVSSDSLSLLLRPLDSKTITIVFFAPGLNTL